MEELIARPPAIVSSGQQVDERSSLVSNGCGLEIAGYFFAEIFFILVCNV